MVGNNVQSSLACTLGQLEAVCVGLVGHGCLITLAKVYVNLYDSVLASH